MNELTQSAYSDIPLIPTLNIALIHTGRSVIIRFREGWRPKLKVKSKELIVEVPAKVALPGLILYALYFGYDKYLEIKGKRLDNNLKKIELREKLKTSRQRPRHSTNR